MLLELLLQLLPSRVVVLCMHACEFVKEQHGGAAKILTAYCLVVACPCLLCVLPPSSQATKCFVLDLDQRAFLAAVKDRHAAGLAPVPASPHVAPAADNSSRLASGPIVVNPATYFGSSTSSGFSNTSWPVGQSVLDFFWGELTLSEGAPFECLTPDGKSTVSDTWKEEVGTPTQQEVGAALQGTREIWTSCTLGLPVDLCQSLLLSCPFLLQGWCSMKNVDKLKSLLISSGLMMRLHAPAQTMKGIETAIQQLMLLGHRKASDKSIPEIVLDSPHEAAESAMAAAAAAKAATAGADAGAGKEAASTQQQQPADGRQLQRDGPQPGPVSAGGQGGPRGQLPPRDPSREAAAGPRATAAGGWDDRRAAGGAGKAWEQSRGEGAWGPGGGVWGDGRPRPQPYNDRYGGQPWQGEEPRMRAWFDRPDRDMRRPSPGAYRGRYEGPPQGVAAAAGGGRQLPSDGRRLQQAGPVGAAGAAWDGPRVPVQQQPGSGRWDASAARRPEPGAGQQAGSSQWADDKGQQRPRGRVPPQTQAQQQQVPRQQQLQVQPQRQRGWQETDIPRSK